MTSFGLRARSATLTCRFNSLLGVGKSGKTWFGMSNALKLLAMDPEDLVVISAHAQDAVARVGDIDYAPEQRRLLIPFNRFAWEKPESRRLFFRRHERRRAVLHVDKVEALRSIGIDRSQTEAVLSLLAVTFEPAETGGPEGTLVFDFAGGASLQADVECIEMRLADLGAAWSASGKPRHPGSTG